MSKQDDQTHAVSEQETEGPAAPIILFFIIGFAASLVIGWGIFPKLLYSQKHQPINFNHVLHVEEVDDGCESCHYFREDGTFSGIPDLESCMECHEDVIGVSAEEEKFVAEYVVPEREVPWLVYSRQPDCVYFSHAPHVIAGKMECAECHGHIGESEHARVYEENRIVLDFDDINPLIPKAFVAAEDGRYWDHVGLDVWSIFRAFINNLRSGRRSRACGTARDVPGDFGRRVRR